MMLKKFLFAVAPMMLVASSVMADDSLLSRVASMDLDGAMNAPAAVEDADELGQADVDALLGDEVDSGEEAIAACFRRIGYGYRYRGYRSYGHYGYRSFYRLLPTVQLLLHAALLVLSPGVLQLHPGLQQLLGMLVIHDRN